MPQTAGKVYISTGFCDVIMLEHFSIPMIQACRTSHKNLSEIKCPKTLVIDLSMNVGKHLDVEPWLCALKKFPLLQPDKLKKEVDIPYVLCH